MVWGTYVLEWVHILLGIFWFGSALYANLILGPAMMRVSPSTRHELVSAMIGPVSFIFTRVGYLTVTAGFIRGTVFGRVQSVDVLFGTRYGVVWLAAFGVGIFLALWSHLVVVPSARQMIAMPQQATGSSTAVAVRPSPMPLVVEMLGFFVLFTLMIVLKFS
jgi:uncharacterized membrane protein